MFEFKKMVGVTVLRKNLGMMLLYNYYMRCGNNKF